MSHMNEDDFIKTKVKKKMSKTEMQLAIIKKRQCDAKALSIVEQLVEQNVDTQWALQNLKYINKNHMEDVIEERAITKTCGYILCNKFLTVTITQQYHISTKNNKVYDVSRRKNFCSSCCYGACNYLLEQMLTSPLWLRDREEIPVFKILSQKDALGKHIVGEEIHVGGRNLSLNVENKVDYVQSNKLTEKKEENSCLIENDFIDMLELTEVSEHLEENDETYVSSDINDIHSKYKNHQSINDEKANKPNYNSLWEMPKKENNLNTLTESESLSKSDEINNVQIGKIKCKSHKNDTKKFNKVKEQPNTFHILVMHIEKCVNEWVTKNTIQLLFGEENVKKDLLQIVTNHDKYLQICKKLSKLQLEDEREDHTHIDLQKSALKPLPSLSTLQKEGKKMKLKVQAFYNGSTVIEESENVENDITNKNSIHILPLTDSHDPKALRHRIFLEKLNKILPDLLKALIGNHQSHSFTQYIYGNERCTYVKALVHTFSLSATNITFKSAEWTLTGLIIIKMLSFIDPQLKIILSTKQALMYISMILMSYKLDSNYLNRFVMELINNVELSNTHQSIE